MTQSTTLLNSFCFLLQKYNYSAMFIWRKEDMNREKDNYYTSIDLFKYISSTLIVFLHVHTLEYYGAELNYYTSEVFCRLAVPFFFLTSGFLFYNGNHQMNFNYTRRYCIRLLKLYIIWVSLYAPVIILINIERNTDPIQLLQYFLFSGAQTHLWYLTALVFAILLLFFLQKKYSLNKILTISMFLYIIGAIFVTYTEVIDKIPFIESIYSIYISIFVQFRNGLFFLCFVVIGAKISTVNFQQHSKITLLCAVIITYFLYNMEALFTYNIECSSEYDMRILLLPVSVMIFLLILNISINIGMESGIILRNISTLTFLSHRIFQLLLKRLFILLRINYWYENTLIMFFCVMVICSLFSLITIKSSKINCFRFLKMMY